MAEKKVAIITGSSKGIGRATAVALLEDGYSVVISDIDENAGKLCEEELQKQYSAFDVQFIKCDVSLESDYAELFKKALFHYGRVDVLVNNAGIVGEEDPEKLVRVNFFGVVYGCKAAIEFMGTPNGGKGGHVINIASVVGLIPTTGAPVYAATKHGVVGLTRSYGKECYLEKYGLTFNTICPTFVNTDLFHDSVKQMKGTLDVSTRTDVIEPEVVAQGVIKILQEKPNGATLVTGIEGLFYVGTPNELQHIQLY